ncbi:chemotaxis protein CheX [Bdellovibrionota bacterium FG-1]
MPQLDVNFFKPFIDGTLNTLKIQCQLEATHAKPFIKGTQPQPKFEIAGVIGLTSETFAGNITICFPAVVYLTLMSNMLGEKYTEITQELQDGAAELLNIIFGSAKAILNKQGYTIQKAIPTVIRGESLQTSYIGSGQVIVLPFVTPAGDFHIEISMETKSLS